MRQTFLLLILSTLVTVSCEKTNPGQIPLDQGVPEGTYTGTFQRQTSTGGQISNVTITFTENNWTGQSQMAKYPALCHGTYKRDGGDNITFNNGCAWTAEFDWTLILGQDYKIKTVDKSVEITREYNGGMKDVYKLTKQ